MAYDIRPHNSFERPFSKLTTGDKKRVIEKLELIAQHPEKTGAPMGNLPADLRGLHKIRVGDRRLFFWVDNEKKEIVPYTIDKHDKAYKNLYKS
ncbi:MAG: hypothetical protein HYW90_02110 [Candidatus Sungbacteria bacterium]|nr:hypothetical protein [Candidatus Sungbacteria bacterium]